MMNRILLLVVLVFSFFLHLQSRSVFADQLLAYSSNLSSRILKKSLINELAQFEKLNLEQVYSMIERKFSELGKDLLENQKLITNQDVDIKSDDSPVSKWDLETQKVLEDFLPSILNEQDIESVVFGEESYGKGEFDKGDSQKNLDYFKDLFLRHDFTWLIDPIDGTSSFISKDNRWSIVATLFFRGIPILSINYYPESPYGEDHLSFGGFISDEGALINRVSKTMTTVTLDDEIVKRSYFYVGIPQAEVPGIIESVMGVKPLIITKTFSQGVLLAPMIDSKLNNSEKIQDVLFLKRTPKAWDILALIIPFVQAGGVVLDVNGKILFDDNFYSSGWLDLLTPDKRTGEPRFPTVIFVNGVDKGKNGFFDQLQAYLLANPIPDDHSYKVIVEEPEKGPLFNGLLQSV